jgi:hypothetical protein
MPNRREIRYWTIAALALMWMGFLWIVWEWLHAASAPSATVAESVAQSREAQRSVEHTFWVMLGTNVFGLLACTRFAWCWLRQDEGK